MAVAYLWEMEQMADEETRQYWRETKNNWISRNLERSHEIDKRSAKKFYDARKDDAEFMEMRREVIKVASKKHREKIKSTASPEEKAARRAADRERLRQWRAKKKAEAAQQKTLEEQGKDEK